MQNRIAFHHIIYFLLFIDTRITLVITFFILGHVIYMNSPFNSVYIDSWLLAEQCMPFSKVVLCICKSFDQDKKKTIVEISKIRSTPSYSWACSTSDSFSVDGCDQILVMRPYDPKSQCENFQLLGVRWFSSMSAFKLFSSSNIISHTTWLYVTKHCKIIIDLFRTTNWSISLRANVTWLTLLKQQMGYSDRDILMEKN